MNHRSHAATLLLLVLGLSSVTSASADTMEERLRAQLRSTAQQLQALQSEQARNAAAKQAAETQLSAAQAQVKQLSAELAKAAGQSQQLAAQQDGLRQQAQAQMASSNEQVGKFKKAYEELLTLARTKDAERAKAAGQLTAQLAERDTQVQQCAAQNQRMYGLAKDILTAYEKVDVADVIKMRQPFAGSARVKFEEMAQGLGDDLYKTQFDAGQKPVTQ
jgi:DNA repair exonuclease SbcCD ATPase subunit